MHPLKADQVQKDKQNEESATANRIIITISDENENLFPISEASLNEKITPHVVGNVLLMC